MNNMLDIKDLNFAYGNVQTIFDLSASFGKSQIHCVTGRNGVGKTTLMKNIMGLVSSKSGSIELEHSDITKMPPYKRVKQGLAYVPQGRHIFPRLSVEDNLKTGLSSIKEKVPEDIYDYFPVLKEMGQRMGGDLSGGQQQQLAIGRALVTQPQVLILDEPTEGIQPNIIQRIGEVLKDLCEQRGMTIIIVEQYLDFIRDFCHTFAIMNRGQVVAQGDISDLSEDLVVQYLHV
jgi:urea transport system ATP-binding protein